MGEGIGVEDKKHNSTRHAVYYNNGIQSPTLSQMYITIRSHVCVTDHHLETPSA